MKLPLRRSPAVLAIAALAVGVLAAPSSAAQPTDPNVAVNPAADSPSAAAAVAAAWTPEAMKSAVPLDVISIGRSAAKRVTTNVPLGAQQTVQPTAAPAAIITPQSFPNGGGTWTGAGAVRTNVGRVFFMFGGRRVSCSGTAVTSANKSTVTTAGHCVKLEGTWHTDWVFVPGYNNGDAPYGTWAATETLTTPQWEASEDLSYDVGAAVVSPLDGELLTDVVGAQGVTFNQPNVFQRMYAFGYPAAAPYDGTRLIYCSGLTLPAVLSTGIGMVCNMTGGASGGPWFRSFNEGTGLGLQSSVNSYKIIVLPTLMFGPTFGADAQNLYNTAQNT